MKRNVMNLPFNTVIKGMEKLLPHLSPEQWEGIMVAEPRHFEGLSKYISQTFPIPVHHQYKDSPSQARCRELFGDDFFGLTEASRAFQDTFTSRQLALRETVCLWRDGQRLSEEESWQLIEDCQTEEQGSYLLCCAMPYAVCQLYTSHQHFFHLQSRMPDAWFMDPRERKAWSGRGMKDTWFLLHKRIAESGFTFTNEMISWVEESHVGDCCAHPNHILQAYALCKYGREKEYTDLWPSEKKGRTVVNRRKSVYIHLTEEGVLLLNDTLTPHPREYGAALLRVE